MFVSTCFSSCRWEAMGWKFTSQSPYRRVWRIASKSGTVRCPFQKVSMSSRTLSRQSEATKVRCGLWSRKKIVVMSECSSHLHGLLLTVRDRPGPPFWRRRTSGTTHTWPEGLWVDVTSGMGIDLQMHVSVLGLFKIETWRCHQASIDYGLVINTDSSSQQSSIFVTVGKTAGHLKRLLSKHRREACFHIDRNANKWVSRNMWLPQTIQCL